MLFFYHYQQCVLFIIPYFYIIIFLLHNMSSGSYLTLKCILYHICDAVLKFWFSIKKGSSKKFPNERRAYESVDDGTLSLAVVSRKTMEI